MRPHAGPCRNVRRPLPRHGVVSLNDAPPAELSAALAVLHDSVTVDEARDVLEFVPIAQRPRLVSWMAGRRQFRWEAMHAVVTSLDEPALRRAVGSARADNLVRLYG